MAILKIKDEDGVIIEVPAIRGPQGPTGSTGPIGPAGPRGQSGVYVGSGEMPDDCNVQVSPVEWVTVVKQQIVDPEDIGDGVGAANLSWSAPLIAGYTYRVTINDKVYLCKAYNVKVSGDPDYKAVGIGAEGLVVSEIPGAIVSGTGDFDKDFGILYDGEGFALYTKEINTYEVWVTNNSVTAALRVKDATGNVILVPAVGLPKVEMTATHDDGTTSTFVLYGEVNG